MPLKKKNQALVAGQPTTGGPQPRPTAPATGGLSPRPPGGIKTPGIGGGTPRAPGVPGTGGGSSRPGIVPPGMTPTPPTGGGTARPPAPTGGLELQPPAFGTGGGTARPAEVGGQEPLPPGAPSGPPISPERMQEVMAARTAAARESNGQAPLGPIGPAPTPGTGGPDPLPPSFQPPTPGGGPITGGLDPGPQGFGQPATGGGLSRQQGPTFSGTPTPGTGGLDPGPPGFGQPTTGGGTPSPFPGTPQAVAGSARPPSAVSGGGFEGIPPEVQNNPALQGFAPEKIKSLLRAQQQDISKAQAEFDKGPLHQLDTTGRNPVGFLSLFNRRTKAGEDPQAVADDLNRQIGSEPTVVEQRQAQYASGGSPEYLQQIISSGFLGQQGEGGGGGGGGGGEDFGGSSFSSLIEGGLEGLIKSGGGPQSEFGQASRENILNQLNFLSGQPGPESTFQTISGGPESTFQPITGGPTSRFQFPEAGGAGRASQGALQGLLGGAGPLGPPPPPPSTGGGTPRPPSLTPQTGGGAPRPPTGGLEGQPATGGGTPRPPGPGPAGPSQPGIENFIDQRVIDRNTESLREGLDRQRNSQTDQLRARLAARGLISEDGAAQGAEGTALGGLERDLAGIFASGARDIGTGELTRARGTFEEALKLGESGRQFDLGLQEQGREFDTGLGEESRQFNVGTNEGARRFDTGIGEQAREFNVGTNEGARRFDEGLNEQARQFNTGSVNDLLGLSESSAGRDTSNLLGALGQGTGRQAFLTDAALESTKVNQAAAEFAAQFGLQREQVMESIRQNRTGQLAQLLSLFMQGAQIGQRGAVPPANS